MHHLMSKLVHRSFAVSFGRQRKSDRNELATRRKPDFRTVLDKAYSLESPTFLTGTEMALSLRAKWLDLIFEPVS
jgi:hypothetical protein